jgi:6-pyruvoyltetrahydropterin/6-carboxytetrahydropterin synthase
MYSISKEFGFSAAHYLTGLSPSHPCSQLHGHNYKVKIELLTKALDKVGFVFDYRELDGLKQFLDNTLDHQCINDVWPDMNPTAENIAERIWNVTYAALDKSMTASHDDYGLIVYVSETDKTWASFSTDPTP